MRVGDYEIDIKDIRKRIEKKRILVQLPEGLKIRYREFYDLFLSLGAESVFIYGDPYYGACDRYEGAGFDQVIQIGHTPFPEIEEGVLQMHWIGVVGDEDLNAIATRLREEGIERVGLLTTAQHPNLLEKVEAYLRSKGFLTAVGRGKRCVYPGQLLGCEIGAAGNIRSEVDGFLFLGDGIFHALPISGKVIAFNPYTKEIETVDVERHFRKRYAAIEWASAQDDWLIVASLKGGQMDLDDCEHLKAILEERGKNVATIAMREVSSSNLAPFDGKAIAIVGCPRICEDFPGTLNPTETLVACDLLEFEDYMADPFRDWRDEEKRA